MDLLQDTNQNDQVQIDESKDYFAELTAPGAKFDLTKYDNDPMKAAQAIAKGKYHADATVEIRNQQIDEARADWKKMREEYNAGPKLKEYLDQLVAERSNHNEPPVDDNKPVYDPQEIERLLETKMDAKLRQREIERNQEKNYRMVESKLAEHYGSNYQSALKQQVDNLGLDKDFVNMLAKDHPEVLFRTLGIGLKQQDNLFQTPTQSTQRRDPFAPAQKRTNAYYQKMRKENPEAYRSPKIQDQMLKDAMQLGDEFKDGDWYTYGHGD